MARVRSDNQLRFWWCMANIKCFLGKEAPIRSFLREHTQVLQQEARSPNCKERFLQKRNCNFFSHMEYMCIEILTSSFNPAGIFMFEILIDSYFIPRKIEPQNSKDLAEIKEPKIAKQCMSRVGLLEQFFFLDRHGQNARLRWFNLLILNHAKVTVRGL